MKYTAKQLKSGQWAVFTGKRYFTHTATDNKLQAKQSALIMSMQFYQSQMDDAFMALEKTCKNKNSLGDILLEGDEDYTCKGDLMC